MASSRPLHKQFFSTNRRLWLSVIPEEKRLDFPGAEKSTPAYLVTSSVFGRRFWNDPKVNLTSAMKKLTSDRAWFGIRSLIKGSKIADDVKANGLCEAHFSQLDSNSKSQTPQLTRGSTDKYYSDEDLRILIDIYHRYDKWITEKKYYDEMDIVRTAHSFLSKPRDDEFKPIDEKAVDKIIYNMDMTVESVEFKQNAIDKIKSKNMTNEMYEKLSKFIGKWLDEGIARGYHPQKTRSGVLLYKLRLNRDARMIFSTTIVKGKNAKIIGTDDEGKPIIEYRPILFIYDICFNHDEQKAWYTKNVDSILHPDFDGPENEENVGITDVEKMSDTPGQGPTKTLPKRLTTVINKDNDEHIEAIIDDLRDLNQPYNISLDDNQKKAIIQNQPLLIDGLAGTGKTAVLARRGVFRSGFAKDDTRILYLASTDAVVQRLVKDTSAQLNNEEYWARYNREFIIEFIGVHNDYERTSRDLTIDEFSMQSAEGFDEVILDECQDITALEFECLKSFVYSEDSRRFTFAGDPLQTLNPTGFDWARIKAMFTESMYDTEEERSKYAAGIRITKFHQNYRSQGNVVRFANAVQAHRAKLIGNSDDQITMEPMLDEKSEPYLIQIGDNEDEEVLIKAIIESGLHNVITICWAADDNQIIELCNSQVADKTLSQVWDSKVDKNKDMHSFRQSLILHSSTSIKGDEHDSVMLYKFGSSHSNLLDSLTTNQEDLTRISQQELISVSFAYSRLYVAITRPYNNIYIVEDEEGIDFWKKACLADENGNLLNLWNSDNKIHYAKEILASGDFLITKDLIESNLEKFKKNWKRTGNLIDGESAIRIAKHLNKMDEVHEIEADILVMQADDPDCENREQLLQDAIKLYKLAKRERKYWPIMFELEQWSNLEGELYKRKNHPFDRIMTDYCKLKQGKITRLSVKDIRTVFNDLTVIRPTNCGDWSGWDNSTRINNFKNEYKKIYLDLFTQNSNKFSQQIFYEDIIREFGFEEIRSRLEKWVDKYPNTYLRLTEEFPDDNYQSNQDNFYGTALMSRYNEIEDSEDRRMWVTKNINKVDDNRKDILRDSQFENLANLIDALPKSNNSYNREKNGFPTFTLRFENNQKTELLNDTEKLFFYLRESLKYSSPDKFKPKYGGGLLLLLELDLTEIYGWAGSFEDIIQSFHSIICNNETLSRIEQTSWINLEFVASIFSKLLLENKYSGTRKSIANEVKDVIWNGGKSNSHDIVKYILDIIVTLNKFPYLRKAEWLKLFNPNHMSYQELTPNVITMIENHNNYFERCMNNKIGGDTYLNIIQLYSLYIQHHFHNKTTELDSVMLLTITRKKFWDEDHQKLAMLIDFHHTDEGKNLLALLEKDIQIDINILQPYIDDLRNAKMDALATKYESKLKLTMETIRSKLDSTTSIDEWTEEYSKISNKLDENKLSLTQEDIISLLSKEECDELPELNTLIRAMWTSFVKEGSDLGELVKVVDKLSVKNVLNIFRMSGKSVCYVALLTHKEFNKIRTSFDSLFIFDLENLITAENQILSKEVLIPSGKIAQRERIIASTKHQKLLEKRSRVNDLYMKIYSMSSVLPYCIAFMLAKEKTDTLTGYKNSLGISSGSGSKAKHIEAILKHFNIEIDEDVNEIIALFSK